MSSQPSSFLICSFLLCLTSFYPFFYIEEQKRVSESYRAQGFVEVSEFHERNRETPNIWVKFLVQFSIISTTVKFAITLTLIS